jgi:hypothetical protein
MIEQQMVKRIVELEYEMTLAIRNGHKACMTDKFQYKRQEVDMLRCIYFGLDSPHCKIKKGGQ